MNLSNFDLLLIGMAITAVMMLGTTNIRTGLALYAWHTLFIAACAAWLGYLRGEPDLLAVALVIAIVKSGFVPWFLNDVVRKVGVQGDPGVFIPAPVSMHLGIALLGGAYLLAKRLPSLVTASGGAVGVCVALSLIASGMLLMVTRKIAVNQVIGFLVIENGIFLFSLIETRGMPLGVEMGAMLDLLVAVMIAGVLSLRIKKNFEHIDVTRLTELRD